MEERTRQHIEQYGSKVIVARDSFTEEYLRKFHSLEELREIWPSAEIVSIEEYDHHIVVYC